MMMNMNNNMGMRGMGGMNMGNNMSNSMNNMNMNSMSMGGMGMAGMQMGMNDNKPDPFADLLSGKGRVNTQPSFNNNVNNNPFSFN